MIREVSHVWFPAEIETTLFSYLCPASLFIVLEIDKSQGWQSLGCLEGGHKFSLEGVVKFCCRWGSIRGDIVM